MFFIGLILGMIVGMLIIIMFALQRINELEKENSKERRRADKNFEKLQKIERILINSDEVKENYHFTLAKIKTILNNPQK